MVNFLIKYIVNICFIILMFSAGFGLAKHLTDAIKPEASPPVPQHKPEQIDHSVTVHDMPEYQARCFTYGQAISCVNSFEVNWVK